MPGILTTEENKIRILFLEDQEIDTELILHQLRRAGFDPDWQRVDTELEFTARLAPTIDLILADYCLPQFDALAALRCVQQRNLDIPFIIISGAVGDELAVQFIKHGVTDYLLKDRLERLGLAVSNALEEKRNRAERKRAEEQLRQAQKLEAIGQLAGGIAHDFSNVLTIINGRIWLLLEHESFSRESTAALKEVQRAGERAANLTRQLLLFSRKHPLSLRPTALNQLITETAGMLRRLIGEHICIDLKLETHLPLIEADESMMAQIVINLAVNARDAMPLGGNLTISTRALARTAEDVRGKRNAQPGDFACISVTDSGCGIPAENLSRIFEPFFTTKETGKGTGLGLATVIRIVQEHRGWIEVESEIGVGTTFKVFLPLAAQSSPAPPEPDQPAGSVEGGGETLLVVEDDAGVRELTVSALRYYGYEVLEARSGVDALEVWRQDASRIDLLLTDMVMPDSMSGLELATRLQAEKPELPVIFTSGYMSETKGREINLRHVVPFIHKPFQPWEIAAAVRDLLDGRVVESESRL